MKDISVNGAAGAQPQQNWTREQEQQVEAAAQVNAAGEEEGMPPFLSQKEEEGKTLIEMIREAQEKADAKAEPAAPKAAAAQREAMKLPKNNTRYGDAPLEAYARLARAKNKMEVNSASGYARRRLAQFRTALRTDSDNAAKIKAAISQLQKAVNRGEKKKRELDREHLTDLRRKKAAKEEQREKEQRLRQELRRRKSQRMIRESGYLREAEISDRLATQLTATQMELRQQFQDLPASTTASMEAAVQQYAAVDASVAVAAAPMEIGFSGQA